MSGKWNGTTSSIGNPSSSSSNSLVTGNKKWQMELLMERLRSKSSQYKPLQDTSKNIRMTMLEKRYALDAVEKSNLQKCLDSMQYCIKVTTRQGLVDRLESLSRQLGLKFMDDNDNLFISSDMFYLEIILDANGKVRDVKVHHECKIEQQSCKELVSCLLKGDFADFTNQLEGLTSIYQLNADSKTKSNAFVALQALETDLQHLFTLQQCYKDPHQLLVQSPVGVLEPRRGGHPMRLTYFVPPYQLLDVDSNAMTPLTVELIHAEGASFGMSVTVHLEASASNKLQIEPILSIQKDERGGASKPIYTAMNADNSIMLPACFVLRLNKLMPIGIHLLRQIEQITRIKFLDDVLAKSQSMLSLIANHVTEGLITSATKGLFVSLPDQSHCYFLTENHALPGVLIKTIPFTEPSHVPQILHFLRQQALFNTLITSCIRTTNAKPSIENAIMFEINALSCQHISIALEHPYHETMATIELDLTGLSTIKCNIFSMGNNYNSLTPTLSRIMQTCASIPVTVRALMKFWDRENANKLRGLDTTNLSLLLSQSDRHSDGSSKGDHRENGNTNRNLYGANSNSNGNSINELGNGHGDIRNVENGAKQRNYDVASNSNSYASSQNTSASGTGGSVGAVGGNGMITAFASNSSLFTSGEKILPKSGKAQKTTVSNPITGTTVVSNSNPNAGSASISTTSASTNYLASDGGGGSSNNTGQINAKRRRTDDFFPSPKREPNDATIDQSAAERSSNRDGKSMGISAAIGRFSEDGLSGGNSSASGGGGSSSKDRSDDAKSMKTSSSKLTSSESDKLKTNRSDGTMEQIKKKQKRREDKLAETSSSLSPSVSITPITSTSSGGTGGGGNTATSSSSSSSSFNSVLTGLERRPGIEIIPISSQPAQNLKSSITITPINSTSKNGSAGTSDKRCASNSSSSTMSETSVLGTGSGSGGGSSSKKSDERSKLEKKKKRKREGSPMGPPEKMPLKQDPLSRPVSVSIKTTDGSPISPSNLLRKFNSTSPVDRQTGNRQGMGQPDRESAGSRQTDRESSGSWSLSSPKSNHYSTSSPKHSNSASGKPSMSALKSATNSPNSKSNLSGNSSGSSSGSSGERIKTYSSSSSRDSSRERDRDRDRDRDREKDRALKYSSGGSSSPKMKVSSAKKQIDVNTTAFLSMDNLIDPSASNQDLLKAAGQATQKRKGSLSAVIDKLKSAHHVSDESPPNTPTVTTAPQTIGASNSSVDSRIAGESKTSSSRGFSQDSAKKSGRMIPWPESGQDVARPTFLAEPTAGGPTSTQQTVSGGNINTNSSSPTSSAINVSSLPISITSLKNNSEYMVKHSSDGMKITINKTRTKDASSPSSKQSYHHSSGSGSSSGSNSPKTHTGLKPGVNSGPASKKPQQNPPLIQNNVMASMPCNTTAQMASLNAVAHGLMTQSSTNFLSTCSMSNTTLSISNTTISRSNTTLARSNPTSSLSNPNAPTNLPSSSLTPNVVPKTSISGLESAISAMESSKSIHESVSTLEASKNAMRAQYERNGQAQSSSTKSLISKSSSSGSLPSSTAVSSNLSSDCRNTYKKDKNRSTSVKSSSGSSGNGSDRRTDVMKLLGLPSNSSTISLEGSTKSWDAKYQIPKLSARSNANDKDATTVTSTNAHFLSNDKLLYSSMGSGGGNTTSSTSNKLHGGRASSVSPKYSLSNDVSSGTSSSGGTSISNFNKDLHIFKSTSSDALQNSGSHLTKNLSFSNPTTPTSLSSPSQFSTSIPLFSHQINSTKKKTYDKIIDFSNASAFMNTNIRTGSNMQSPMTSVSPPASSASTTLSAISTAPVVPPFREEPEDRDDDLETSERRFS